MEIVVTDEEISGFGPSEFSTRVHVVPIGTSSAANDGRPVAEFLDPMTRQEWTIAPSWVGNSTVVLTYNSADHVRVRESRVTVFESTVDIVTQKSGANGSSAPLER